MTVFLKACLLIGGVAVASPVLGQLAIDPRRPCGQDEVRKLTEGSLADRMAAFKTAATGSTDWWEERQMECLLLSVAAQDLPHFKFTLEYDGDDKDLEEYVFHDVDDTERRGRMLAHLATAPPRTGIKVLTDVDDTMFANLVDKRYPKKALYPGVLEFYDALRHEPFPTSKIPLTTLSARPNPIAGDLEARSLASLIEKTGGRLQPSALSGSLVSSLGGTVQTVLRQHQEAIDLLCDDMDGQEREIGVKKFENATRFAAVYPEYRYVFVGDSGQADALTAHRMVSGGAPPWTSRVITTFIHDLRPSAVDQRSTSPSFRALPREVVVTGSAGQGRGVIVFRNYVQAAVIAYRHRGTLGDLITADELARVTEAAVGTLEASLVGVSADGRRALVGAYKADAEEAAGLLAAEQPQAPALERIRSILKAPFWTGLAAAGGR